MMKAMAGEELDESVTRFRSAPGLKGRGCGEIEKNHTHAIGALDFQSCTPKVDRSAEDGGGGGGGGVGVGVGSVVGVLIGVENADSNFRFFQTFSVRRDVPYGTHTHTHTHTHTRTSTSSLPEREREREREWTTQSTAGVDAAASSG